jgi:hypothetical protein
MIEAVTAPVVSSRVDIPFITWLIAGNLLGETFSISLSLDYMESQLANNLILYPFVAW